MASGRFGYMCSYFPVEVLMAAGYHPVRVLPAGPAPPGGMLPSFLCAPVRTYLAAGMAGAYRHLAGLGMTHACDAMQCLAQTWEVLVKEPPLYLLRFPTRRDGAARDRLVAGLHDLAGRLPAPVLEQDLVAAMAAMQVRRRRLHDILRQRSKMPPETAWSLLSDPWRAGSPDDGAEVRNDGAGPPDDGVGWDEGAADTPGGGGGGPPRIVLCGSILASSRLLEMVSEAGGAVAGDDLCTGERGLGPALPALDDEKGGRVGPWEALAEQYLAMPPCPCRHPSLGERVAYLMDLVAARRAEGVIVLREKFCEPHRWEDHAVVAELRQRGLGVLELETEAGDVAGERDLTRLQAFL
ncbi:MAG: 2-hydroxyacyl-CoA dehydratase family protein, partial [Bacillota bacterium]|nr:2-hydroxyacyl-CoA dehydratase family protein [Bacillota bacterium]